MGRGSFGMGRRRDGVQRRWQICSWQVSLFALLAAAALIAGQSPSPSPPPPSPSPSPPPPMYPPPPPPYSPPPSPKATVPVPAPAPAPGPGPAQDALAPGPAIGQFRAVAPASGGACTVQYIQALSSNKPYPSGVGGSGIALASDGSVALLSGSPATATTPANAFLFSFYTSANQYNSCPQQISDPYPLSGLKWGASFAISGDASVVLVGAPGQVISGALTTGTDRAIDGKVFVYKLPSLPGGQSRGYSVTDRPLAAPANATVRSPNFGSTGIATTVGAEYIYVASPAGPQGTPQLTNLYGTPTVYVYKDQGNNNLALSQTIPAPGGTNNSDFGRRIAVSSTGKVLVVADPLYTTGPQSCGIFGSSPGYLTNGQVYIYTLDADTYQYNLSQTLSGNTSSVTGFGTDIGLSADGTVLVVGLPDAGYGGRSVRVFLADQAGTFVERLNVTAPNNGPGSSRFGAQVALSGDGQLLVVHAPLPYSRLYNTPGNENSGNVYTYKLSIGANAVSGAPQAYLTCPNDQYGQSKTCDDFGDKMALSANGKILILTGGFKQVQMDGMLLMQQAVYNSYVYQTANCVSDRASQGA